MKLLIVGAGTLGSELVRLLHAEHEITVMDDDVVEVEKGVFRKEHLGMRKVDVLSELFSVREIPEKLGADNFREFLDFDMIIEASDSFRTKNLVNEMHLEFRIPVLIAGMDSRSLLVVVPERGRCYRCLVRGKEPRVCSRLEQGTAEEFSKDIKSILSKTDAAGKLFYKDRGEVLKCAPIPERNCPSCMGEYMVIK